MKRIVLLATLCASFLQAATAQLTSVKEQPSNVYTIQLGTFDPSVKQADFEAIRAYAYVYQRDGVVLVPERRLRRTAASTHSRCVCCA